jgi:beta-glucosidase
MTKRFLPLILSLMQASSVLIVVPPAFLKFPDGFYWGASTSSHQVEGNTTNDWSDWEGKNAVRLADGAADRYSKLPAWQDIQAAATSPSNYLSGKGDDEYHLYNQDFDLAKSINLNAYRFSLEWSRLEPQEGVFDDAAFQHYSDELQALKVRGIEPFVTLNHWTLPLWLSQKGGWENSQSSIYFQRYAEHVEARIGTLAKYWITINEPEVYVGNSYLTGTWPPQKHNPFSAWTVTQNLIAAHKKAYAALKVDNPKLQVGIAKPYIYLEDAGQNWISGQVKATGDYWYNTYFLDQIKDTQDFIGINYYMHNRINAYGFFANENAKVSDLGWELYPEGIYHAITDYKSYGKPIFITENGLADAKDINREWYIRETLRQVHRAIADGADVRGYLYWSLLDNFEWSEGYWPKFGLFSVDPLTGTRIARPSAQAYAKIISDNGLTP